MRTTGAIEPLKVGSIASDMMEEEEHWKNVRPRGFLRNVFRQDKDWNTGVYILVSTNPALLQIRYGPDLRMAAYQQGIACGPWYRQRQSYTPGQLDSHLLQTMTDLSDAVHRMQKPSWIVRKLQWLSSLVWSEMEDWIMPSDNFFTDKALKNYLWLMSILGGTGSVWRFTLVSLALYVVVWLLGKKILLDTILLPRIQKNAAKGRNPGNSRGRAYRISCDRLCRSPGFILRTHGG